MSRRVLLPPMPPNPTVAMFTVSLGAWKPRPSTWRGTMVKPAPAAAVVVRNLRLEMSLMGSPARGFYRWSGAPCTIGLTARILGTMKHRCEPQSRRQIGAVIKSSDGFQLQTDSHPEHRRLPPH